MSREKIIQIAEIDQTLLNKDNILVCNASAIKCKELIELRKRFEDSGVDTIIFMPESDLEEGTSGYAKAQILTSIPGVLAVVATTEYSIRKILKDNNGNVSQLGEVSFSEKEIISTSNSTPRKLSIPFAVLDEDRNFIEKAKALTIESDCWWRPTVCLFVKDEELIAKGISTNVWKTDCCSLKLKNIDIDLNPGERISFCNAIHAEKAGIADAAKRGISLNNSTVYLTTGPCEDCAQELIQTGVRRVVFELNPPDNEGLYLLSKSGVTLERIKPN